MLEGSLKLLVHNAVDDWVKYRIEVVETLGDHYRYHIYCAVTKNVNKEKEL